MDVVIFMLYMYLFFLFEEFYIFILYIEKCLSFKVEVFGLCLDYVCFYYMRVYG